MSIKLASYSKTCTVYYLYVYDIIYGIAVDFAISPSLHVVLTYSFSS